MKMHGPLADHGLKAFKPQGRYKPSDDILQRVWILGIHGYSAIVWNRSVNKTLQQIGFLNGADHTLKSGHERDPIQFLTRLAEWLEEARYEDAFERLVFIADNATLTSINNVLSTELMTSVLAEIPVSDLRLETKDIEKTIEDLVRF